MVKLGILYLIAEHQVLCKQSSSRSDSSVCSYKTCVEASSDFVLKNSKNDKNQLQRKIAKCNPTESSCNNDSKTSDPKFWLKSSNSSQPLRNEVSLQLRVKSDSVEIASEMSESRNLQDNSRTIGSTQCSELSELPEYPPIIEDVESSISSNFPEPPTDEINTIEPCSIEINTTESRPNEINMIEFHPIEIDTLESRPVEIYTNESRPVEIYTNESHFIENTATEFPKFEFYETKTNTFEIDENEHLEFESNTTEPRTFEVSAAEMSPDNNNDIEIPIFIEKKKSDSANEKTTEIKIHIERTGQVNSEEVEEIQEVKEIQEVEEIDDVEVSHEIPDEEIECIFCLENIGIISEGVFKGKESHVCFSCPSSNLHSFHADCISKNISIGISSITSSHQNCKIIDINNFYYHFSCPICRVSLSNPKTDNFYIWAILKDFLLDPSKEKVECLKKSFDLFENVIFVDRHEILRINISEKIDNWRNLRTKELFEAYKLLNACEGSDFEFLRRIIFNKIMTRINELNETFTAQNFNALKDRFFYSFDLALSTIEKENKNIEALNAQRFFALAKTVYFNNSLSENERKILINHLFDLKSISLYFNAFNIEEANCSFVIDIYKKRLITFKRVGELLRSSGHLLSIDGVFRVIEELFKIYKDTSESKVEIRDLIKSLLNMHKKANEFNGITNLQFNDKYSKDFLNLVTKYCTFNEILNSEFVSFAELPDDNVESLIISILKSSDINAIETLIKLAVDSKLARNLTDYEPFFDHFTEINFKSDKNFKAVFDFFLKYSHEKAAFCKLGLNFKINLLKVHSEIETAKEYDVETFKTMIALIQEINEYSPLIKSGYVSFVLNRIPKSDNSEMLHLFDFTKLVYALYPEEIIKALPLNEKKYGLRELCIRSKHLKNYMRGLSYSHLEKFLQLLKKCMSLDDNLADLIYIEKPFMVHLISMLAERMDHYMYHKYIYPFKRDNDIYYY